MQNSTLITIFRLFHPDEIRLLEQTINTPLFKLPNRHSDTVHLFQYLLPLTPDFNDETLLSKEYVATQLFGHRAQPQTELRKAMSNLLGILKKFVLFQQFTRKSGPDSSTVLHEIQTDFGLLKWLTDRSGDIAQPSKSPKVRPNRPSKARSILAHQYRTLQEMTTQLSDEALSFTQRDYSDWLLFRFRQEFEMYVYFGLQRSLQEQQQHLLTALEALDHFYYQQKMTMIVNLQVNLMSQSPTDDIASIINNQIEHTQLLDQSPPAHLAETPIHLLYSTVFRMLRDQGVNDQHYETINQLMQSGKIRLPKEVIQTLRIVLGAYCAIMYIRTGDAVFLQRRFDLQKTDLKEELKSNGNTITATRLSGTVSNALRAGEQNYSWVADLLKGFQQGVGILATDTPREVYKVNQAHLLFAQGKHKEAANELVGYDWYGRINDSQILLLAIRIDIKTQFELKQFDSDYISRTLDAAEKRITRLSDINEQMGAMTLNFLRLIRQIGLLAAKGRAFYSSDEWTGKLAEFERTIQEKPIAEKDWLQGLVAKMALGR